MPKRIFWNQDAIRIRAFWRFLAQFVFTILLLNLFILSRAFQIRRFLYLLHSNFRVFSRIKRENHEGA
jgi:hypothetical protein